ncbi:MAG: rhodanese-like domain-containing protein [Microlunatus sp.]|jgi:rhodanese-related sulfurtransferase|nr:rhodanese-like domain-containing protein [Microlunatus sp.]
MTDITLGDFAAAHATGAAQVIDVREPAEYIAGHVPGATLIPMGQLPDRLNEIHRSKPVFVICQSGGRSSAMTDVLRHHGFDAHSVTGGTAAWTASNRPVATGAPTRK